MGENRINIDAKTVRIDCANSLCGYVMIAAIEELKEISQLVCEKCKHSQLIKSS